MAKKIPKSINLLDSVGQPDDIWEKSYDWLFNIGKYILIFVQIIVLTVFASRFFFDRRNNDLTDQINEQVAILSKEFFRIGEIQYNNVHTFLEDLTYIQDNQDINSKEIGEVLDSVPNYVNLVSFSYSSGKVSMSMTTSTLENMNKYEKFLREQYQDVKMNLSQDSGSEVEFSTVFNLNNVEEEF